MIHNIEYDRNEVKTGILHFGVGNFHRAHEEFFTDRLLTKRPDMRGWGISGAMLLPSDERLYEALSSQDGKYTLTVCGRDGNETAYEIGSLREVMWAGKDKEAIINKIADPAIKIISLTITEGGYNIDKASGDFMPGSGAVGHDLAEPSDPQTVFGIVAEGLRRRIKGGAGGLTILSCDNLQHNGNTARKAFLSFFELLDPELYNWAKENLTFPNSMVDRITPATRAEDIARLNAMNGTEDKAPVYCEDFIQWVIEDSFAAGRPAWEEAGVQFTDDVTDFEQMKLSLLNASHTLLSYPSFLKGYRKVDEAMKDDEIRQLVRDFMDKDATPYLVTPPDTDLGEYKKTLIERFGNHSVSDQISRLCFDGFSKFPVYVNPIARKMIADNKDMSRIAMLVAAYRRYLRYRKDDKGETFEIAEPWMTERDLSLIASGNPVDFLRIAAFEGVDYSASSGFMQEYLKECARRDSNPHVVRH